MNVIEEGTTGGQQVAAVSLADGKTTRKSITFTPSTGRSEKRDVYLYFERNGLPAGVQRVGSFTSRRPPALRTPGDVRVKRGRAGVKVTWDAVPDARTYKVGVRAANKWSRLSPRRVTRLSGSGRTRIQRLSARERRVASA